MFFKIKKVVVVGIILLLSMGSAYAQNLYFAGFTFIGTANQADRYPVAKKIFNANNEIINKKLYESIKNIKRDDLNIIKSDLGSLKSGDSLALAFALSDEKIERLAEKEGVYSFYKVLAQVLVFDVLEKKIVTNFPAAVQYQIYTKKLPTKLEDEKAFEKIYLDLTFDGSIFKDWTSRLEQINIKESGVRHLQIRDVILDSATINQMPQALKDNNIFITQTAQRFEFQLATNQNVPILPYTTGQLGNKKLGLLGRFKDGISYELKLPEPDYVIDILVREFKNAKLEEKNYDGYVYGSFITLKVSEPTTGKIKLDSKFNFKNELTFDKSSSIVILNDWDIYQRTQDLLFSNLTKQISMRDDTQLEKITNTPDIKNQLKEFEEIIKKCR